MAEDSFAFVSEKCDIASIIDEHPTDPLCQQKLKELQSIYCAVRKTRADGSCFYRGLAFAYLEFLLGKQQEILRFKERFIQSKHELLSAGFLEHLFTYYYETFLSIIELAEKDGSVCNLLKAFNHPYVSDAAVQYLRLVTSAFLRNRAEFYQPFIEDGLHMSDFCTQHVEPMTTVCDHIQITALTQALDIPLQVEYVDSMDAVVNRHVFPEGAAPCVYMLYTQDHYSLLYRIHSPEHV